MPKSLSILLPTYNCNCVRLVTELQRQCVESKADFEIIVADDGSPNKNYIEENKEEEHTGTKKADTDAGKESIKDGFEKGSRVY